MYNGCMEIKLTKEIEDFFKFKECEAKKKVIKSLETELKKLKKNFENNNDDSDVELSDSQ